ncbi:S-layer homology domain-containing protein [Cohnella fermenti]|nr:S-layer homology domain-containing protein [Cohnella fermenti]
MRGLKQLALVLVLALFVNVLPAYAAGASDEAIDAFETALGNAQAVGTKDEALTTEVALAEAADPAALSDSELAAYTARLNELVAANDEVLATLATATADYVKSTDFNNSFNSSFKNFLTDPKTYRIGDKKFLRIQVSTVYSLKFTVDGQEGTTVKKIGEPGSVTAVVYDYAIPSFVEPVLSEISYDTGNRIMTHEQYVVLNQDATADDRAELTAAIATAEAVETKDQALTQAIADAKAANNLLSRKATLAAYVTRLNELVAANDKILGTLATATADYVKSTDLNNSFNSSFKNFLSNAQTYQIDDKKYLRIQVSTVYSLKFTVDGQEGTPVKYVGESGSVTAVVYDYAIPSFVEPVLSVISYNTGSRIMTHEQYVVLNQDATEEARTALKSSIATAEAIVNKSDALGQALAAAKDADNLLSRLATLTSATQALNNAIAANTSSTPISTTPVGTDTTGTDTEDTTGTDTDTQENTTTPANPNNGGGSTTPAGPLKDIQGNWAQASIERAVNLNLVTGYTDGTFKPNATINRVEFTAIIVRALGLQPAQSTLAFADSDKVQAWAKQYVQQAVEAGIINGFDDQTFRPSANISRVELAVMLVRGLKLELEEGDLSFKDASAIPAWAKAYVATAVKYGLLQGSTDGSFNPAKEATRAEAITVALRAVDFLAEKAAANS